MEKLPIPEIPNEKHLENKPNLSRKVKKIATGLGIVATSFLPAKDSLNKEVGLLNDISKEMVQERDGKLFLGSENRTIDTYAQYKDKQIKNETVDEYVVGLKKVIENKKSLLKEYKEKILTESNISQNFLNSYNKVADDIDYCESLLSELAPFSSGEVDPKAYSEYINELRNAYKLYDSQKEWLKEVVGSDEYKNRLGKEYGAGQGVAETAKNVRLNLLDKDYNLKEGSTVSEEAQGHYLPKEDLVELPSAPTDSSVGVHEFAHSINIGGWLLTEKAQELYKKAFNSEKLNLGQRAYNEDYQKKYGISYYSNPTEMDARKKQFEYDMERLGVKKYGEEFNDEHYKKIIELENEGKFSDGASEFIQIIKPEFMKQIMNEIADSSQPSPENNQA